MNRRPVKMIVSLLLIVCMLVQYVPSEILGGVYAYAEDLLDGIAEGEHVKNGFWGEVSSQAEKETLQSGEWKYVIMPDTGYAVIVGHTDSSAVSLQIPALLEGADVMALHAGALSDHTMLESVSFPGNIIALGEKAVPRGVTLSGYNASYIQSYAQRNNYAFSTLSGYDFVDGVVDYADIRVGTFERISANELRLRELEAKRLSSGSVFFLVDPLNPYQISYYTVSSMTLEEDGFYRIICTTPGIEEVFNTYKVENTPMYLDPSSVELEEGVELENDAEPKDSVTVTGPETSMNGEEGCYSDGSFEVISEEANTYLDAGLSNELKFEVKPLKIKLGKQGEIALSGSYSTGTKTSFDYAWLKLNSMTVTETATTELSASISYKDNLNGTVDDKTCEKTPGDYLKALAEKAKESKSREYDVQEYKLGSALLFSWGGVLNIKLTLGLKFEISVEGEVSYTSTTTKEYSYEGGQLTGRTVKSSEKSDWGITGKCSIGFNVSLSVALFVVDFISVNLFAGLKAEASYDYVDTHYEIPDQASDFENWLDQPIDMWDCVDIKVSFVVTGTLTLGPKFKYAEFTGSWTFVNLEVELLHLHFHMSGVVLRIENGEIIAGLKKDQIHDADKCPYAFYNAKFILPWLDESENVYKTINDLQYYSKIEKPEDPDLTEYGLKFEGWYTSEDFNKDSHVTEWPYIAQGESPTFYAKTSKLYKGILLQNNGKTIGSYSGTAGAKIEFPELDSDYGLLYWAEVEDPDTMVVINKIEDSFFLVPNHNAYYIAVSEDDIHSYFDDGNGGKIEVITSRGKEIDTPPELPTKVRHVLTGWTNARGGTIDFPLSTDDDTPEKLYFYPLWEYNDVITASELSGFYVASDETIDVSSYHHQNDRDYYTYSVTGDTTVAVSGFAGETPVYLDIPSKVTFDDGKTFTVTSIRAEAFRNAGNTLVCVVVPSTVTSIGTGAFADNENLVLIDLEAAEELKTIPTEMASGCKKLKCALIPNSVTEINSYAFSGCTLLNRADLRADIGQYAFNNCTGLDTLTLGAQVTSIGDYAFNGCTGLKEVLYPDSISTLGKGTLNGCVNITKLTLDGRPKTITSDMSIIGEGSHLKELVLGEGIKELGKNAFNNGEFGFKELVSVIIPDSLNSIGANVFAGSSLTEVVFNNLNLTTANSMLSGCEHLTKVTVRRGSIPDYAFSNCSKLETVIIGDAVISVGEYAFQNCTGLKTLEFSDSVTDYGKFMIYGCTSLERLVVGGGYDGGAFAYYYPVFCIGENSQLSYLEFREGVTSIAPGAFTNYCSDGWSETYNAAQRGLHFPNLSTIVFPESLTCVEVCAFYDSGVETITFKGNSAGICDHAFANCDKLQEVNLDVTSIGSYSFSACDQLKQVTVGNHLETIKDHAFKDCVNLSEIKLENSLTSIGKYAFHDCVNLKALEIPDSVTDYGCFMISGCINLERLVIGGGYQGNYYGSNWELFYIGENSKLSYLEFGEGITAVEPSTFTNSDGTSTLYFTNLSTIVFPSSLKSVGSYAFYGSGIENVTFKSSNAVINEYAFANCDKLQKVKLDVATVNSHGFESCDQLKQVIMGDHLNTIGEYAFSGCKNLEDIDLGNSVTSIGEYAFHNCSTLKALEIPDSVTSYGNLMIYGCTGLERLVVGGGYDGYGSFDYYYPIFCIGENSQLSYVEIREGVTAVAPGAFTNCYSEGWSETPNAARDGFCFPNLTTIILPESLTCVDIYAFYGSGVENIVLKGSNAEICGYAFANCNRLQEISLDVTSIGGYSFLACDQLKQVTVGNHLETIKDHAFKDCVNLSEIKLENSLTSIGEYAFQDCSNLKALEIPDSVTDYGCFMISGCINLERLVIGGGYQSNYFGFNREQFYIGENPKLSYLEFREGFTTVESETFTNSDGSSSFLFPNLSTIVFPESLKSVESYAFYGTGIENVTFKGCNAVIKEYAFANCDKLKKVILDVATIERHSFESCDQLKQVIMGDHLNTIGEYAFSDCKNLEDIDLGNSVTSIGEYAFHNCSTLKALEIPDSVTNYGNLMIYGCTGLERLVVGGGYDGYGSFDYYYPIFCIGENSQLSYIEIREGVTAVAPGAFTNYYSEGWSETPNAARNGIYFPNLTTIILPESLTCIDIYAFYGSKNLSVYCGSEISSIDNNAGMSESAFYSENYNDVISAYAGAVGGTYSCNNVPNHTITLRQGNTVLYSHSYGFRTELDASALVSDRIDIDTIEGWYTDAECTSRWGSASMPNEDLTLYLKLYPVHYIKTVLVFPYGHTQNGDSVAVYEKHMMPVPEEPVCSGYFFFDWYTDPELKYLWTNTYMGEEDVTVYARMIPISSGGYYEIHDGTYTLVSYTAAEGDDGTFYLPSNIDSIPVTAIGANAFPGDDVTTLFLPASVVSIDDQAFEGMSNLHWFQVSSANQNFAAVSGILYSKDKTTLIKYPQDRTAETYTAPSTLQTVGNNAVKNVTALKTLNLNEGLLTVGDSAFAGCTGLASVTLPDSTVTLGESAFAGCSSLMTFEANGLTSVGKNALPDNYGLNVYGPAGSGALRDYCYGSDGTMYTRYNMVTVALEIDGEIYTYVSTVIGTLLPQLLEDLELENGRIILNWFTDSAMTTPWNIRTDVAARELTTLYATASSIFEYETVSAEDGAEYATLTSYHGKGGAVVLPQTIGGVQVTAIGAGFLSAANGKVTSLEIGKNVVSIADDALTGPEAYPFGGTVKAEADSYAAEWAVLHGFTVVSPSYTLSFVTNGASVSSRTATSGTALRLPVPQKTDSVFEGWYTDSALETAVQLDEDSLFVMPSCDTVLYAKWDNQEETVPFTYSETDTGILISGYTGTETSIEIPEKINGSYVTAIGRSAFAGSSVTAVVLPSTVTEIQDNAFSGSALRSIDLGGTKTIGYSAFSQCRSLTSVVMSQVTVIDEAAFSDCTRLRDPGFCSTVTEIGEYAYENCIGLGSITLPDGLTAVNDYCFKGCNSLRSVTLGTQTTELSGCALNDCVSLEAIYVPDENTSFVSADGVLFSADGTTLVRYPESHSGTSYEIPAGVSHLAPSAFAGAGSLTEILLPDSLSTVGERCFEDCTALASVAFTDSMVITGIPKASFHNCSSLTEVTFSSGISSIGSWAFIGCSLLNKITIPATVTEIDPSAFSTLTLETITGSCGSAAQTYAQENDVYFIATDAVSVESIAITDAPETMQYGEGAQLAVHFTPENAEDQSVSWYSTDTGVLRVNNGYVQAVGGGTAEICAVASTGVTDSVSIEVQVPVKKITASPSSVSWLGIQETCSVAAEILPDYATDKQLTWTSSDSRIASVDETGTVTGVSRGEAVITVTAHNGVGTDLPVKIIQRPESVNLNLTETDVFMGETLTLSASVLPEDTDNKNLTWASSDSAVATVSETGVITPVSKGSTVITVTAEDNGLTAECAVRVGVHAEVLVLNYTALSLNPAIGLDTGSLSVSFLPADADEETLTLSVSGDAVSAGEDGVVTALNAGESVITVTSERGLEAQCRVTVETDLQHVLTLPAFLKTVEEEAFRSGNMRFVVVGDQVEQIGDYAFADCAELGAVVFSADVTVSDSAFYNSPGTVLYFPQGSALQTYAENNGLPYVIFNCTQ